LFAMLIMVPAVLFPIWLYHKRKMARESLTQQTQTQANPPEQESELKRVRERVENLEAILCNLDREMNLQMERTLNKVLLASPEQVEVSRMPTTFTNIVSALESRYQVLKELGRGGMGIVFQAHDKQLNEAVAIKILSPLLSNDAEAVERLRREVSAARRITHINVIRIHDISETKGLQYVSMEFFNGRSLKDYIRSRGVLPQQEALDISLQIADGLEAAHRQGVIHRDLKSQNVLINASNQVKIIDFGLAHTTHLQGMTATGLIMGTPEYMAPEQVAGRKVDERADIYSLGVILYELFTGRVPFTGDSAIAVGFRQMKEQPAPPRQWNPDLPEAIERVILKALEKEPLRRYSEVTELKADLEQTQFAPLPSGA
jgi:serine/threonine protein kinase